MASADQGNNDMGMKDDVQPFVSAQQYFMTPNVYVDPHDYLLSEDEYVGLYFVKGRMWYEKERGERTRTRGRSAVECRLDGITYRCLPLLKTARISIHSSRV